MKFMPLRAMAATLHAHAIFTNMKNRFERNRAPASLLKSSAGYLSCSYVRGKRKMEGPF
jgi:hypothetical protein